MEMPPQPRVERQPRITELFEGDPEAVFILTGAMKDNRTPGKENLKSQRFESGSFSDVDQNSGLATGGKDRMLAAVEVQRAYPETTIVPMSRTRSPELPTYASVMRMEMERRGVPSEAVVEESESVDTITSFKQAARFVQEHNWKKVAFLSSAWHLPRSQALFNHIENFADTEEEVTLLNQFADQIRSGALEVQFVSSDDILSSVSDKYRRLFEKVKVDPGIQARVALEAKALGQIQSGTYGKYTLTKKLYEEE
jgi:hypothetical protein